MQEFAHDDSSPGAYSAQFLLSTQYVSGCSRHYGQATSMHLYVKWRLARLWVVNLCISSMVGDVFGRLAGLGGMRSMACEDIGLLHEVETGCLLE